MAASLYQHRRNTKNTQAAIKALTDENAAKNITAEGIRLLWALSTSAPAAGGDVKPKFGRKPKLQASPVIVEAPSAACAN